MKALKKILYLVLLLVLFSCSNIFGEEEETQEEADVNFGTWVDLPSNYNYSEFKTSNSGLYFFGVDYVTDKLVVSRCDASSVTPSWINFITNDIQTFHISNTASEVQDTFGIFYTTASKNGFHSVNTGSPNPTLSNNPISLNNSSAVTELIIDKSPQAYTWAVDGNKIRVKNINGTWSNTAIATLPESVITYEADPKDAVLWMASATRFYKVTVNGAVTTYNLSTYNTNSLSLLRVSKIRFADNKVFFNYQNKILKILGNTISVLYTDTNYNDITKSIEFAVDPTYLYVQNGIKKHIELGNESNFLPNILTSTNYDLVKKITAFQAGYIETSKNATDQNIYALAPADGKMKLLVVSKN